MSACARGRYSVPRGSSASPSVRVSRTTPTIVRQLLVSFGWPTRRNRSPMGFAPAKNFFTTRSLEGVLHDAGFAEVNVRPAGGLPLVRRELHAVAT